MMPVPQPSWAYASLPPFIRGRCHTLRLPDTELDACRSLADVQRLAKRNWRVLAKRYHPDHLPVSLVRRGTPGHTFRRMARAYTWLMALDPTIPWTPRRRRPATLPDDELPGAFQRRPLPLPWGYHEPPLC